MQKKFLKVFTGVILFIWCSFLLSTKIDLTSVDLGRHLENGKILLNSFSSTWAVKDVLTTNLYSYTYPSYPFINHHWAAGVIFFLIYKAGGFVGLSYFYILALSTAFLLFFYVAYKTAGFKLAVFLSLFLLPLIAERKEIRPELFSYVLSAVFFCFLWFYKNKALSYRYLLVLPLLEILWINTHLYFFLGLILIAIFLADQMFIASFKKVKALTVILFFTSLSTLVNPFGLKNVHYPLFIFQNYGYRVLEEQSVFFLEKLHVVNPNFVLFKIVLLAIISSFILVLVSNRKKFSLLYLFLSLLFGIMALLQIRNFTLFALFALPILSYNLDIIIRRYKDYLRPNVEMIAVISIVILFLNYYNYLPFYWHKFGVGLSLGNNAAADFFMRNKLSGPIFNNYDVGGYLIYYLYPEVRVFTDNRPEAYPSSFFTDIYIPLQEDMAFWQEKNTVYNFNVIFFSHNDATPWGQKFLIDRVNDTNWAPVYLDPTIIIFLKRTADNEAIIKKFEIPKERFKVVNLAPA